MNPLISAITDHLSRQSELAKLAEELEALDRRKVEVESRIRTLLKLKAAPETSKRVASSDTMRPGPKTSSDVTLANFLFDILSRNPPMEVRQLADAAIRDGYQSSSAHFTKLVRQALSDGTRFGKTEKKHRGFLYTNLGKSSPKDSDRKSLAKKVLSIMLGRGPLTIKEITALMIEFGHLSDDATSAEIVRRILKDDDEGNFEDLSDPEDPPFTPHLYEAID